ncbi:MAG: GDSL-type esterase/lipase family protein [Polyangiales bacterium]
MPKSLALVGLVLATIASPSLEAQDSESLLGGFHRALRQAEQRPVRVGVYGASHTANDEYTRVLRASLQRRFGDGGLGWFLPSSPFAFYARDGVELSGHGWTGHRVRGRERRRDDYGLAGFFLNTEQGASSRVLLPSHGAQSLALSYLQQPGGGRLVVSWGDEVRQVETSGPRRTLTVTLTESLGDARELELTATGRVRVFGLDMGHAVGVTVDAFGVPGTRAGDQIPWRERSLVRSQRSRPFDLVVLAYGTNESARRERDSERGALQRVVRGWRARAPNAACLLVGPGEWPRRRRGQWRPRPRMLEVIAEQRRVAAEEGCAFFDVYTWMGGEGSMSRWVEQGLALEDHVHFTSRGYARLGSALYAFVVDGMESDSE